MDEKEAVRRLKRGDLSGLEALVELYQLQAVRVACLITGDRALAEDIVQAAFIRAGERIDQFDDRRPFGPWFLRSAVNAAFKAAGQQKRLVSLDQEDGAIELTDPAPLPEALVEARETSLAVWQALQQLPPPQRAAIVMRYYLGMSEAEITRTLGGPLGTLKWWLHAARQKLAKLLRPILLIGPESPDDHQVSHTRERRTGETR